MSQIHYRRGDIFKATTQTIVNTVNCKGVMGKGLALEFKQRYPDMFIVYQEECKSGKLRIGRPSLYRESSPWILNFPTKDNWKANSKIEYLEKGLAYFVSHYKKADITSIAFPKLGAQNGKLSWDEVGPLMVRYLSQLDIDVYIYIAEGDREYTEDSEAKAAAWRQFNELALSPERLQQEVFLSPREAKKVAAKHTTIEFASLSDISSIEGLAQASLKRIKSYIHRQQYSVHELPGMMRAEESVQPKTKSRARSAKPKRKATQETTAASYNEASLFSLPKVIV